MLHGQSPYLTEAVGEKLHRFRRMRVRCSISSLCLLHCFSSFCRRIEREALKHSNHQNEHWAVLENATVRELLDLFSQGVSVFGVDVGCQFASVIRSSVFGKFVCKSDGNDIIKQALVNSTAASKARDPVSQRVVRVSKYARRKSHYDVRSSGEWLLNMRMTFSPTEESSVSTSVSDHLVQPPVADILFGSDELQSEFQRCVTRVFFSVCGVSDFLFLSTPLVAQHGAYGFDQSYRVRCKSQAYASRQRLVCWICHTASLFVSICGRA